MLVGADAIADNVLRRYLQEKMEIRKYFNQIDDRVSFTVEVWTSPNGFSVFGIMYQKRENRENMARYVLEVLNDFNISNKILCITGDNAAAN
jgi:hypothetical protein